MEDQAVSAHIMTDKQELRISIPRVELYTPHELANMLDAIALVLRRMPDETFAELKKQDMEVIRVDLRNQ